MAGPSDVWHENRPFEGRLPPLRLREIWSARELVYFFALRDLRARYKQAVLGVAWVVLVPLIGAASFTLLFNGLADIETDGSYFVFALSGFVIWTFASTLIASIAGTLLDHEDLITHVSFPMIAAPLSIVVVGLVDLAVGFLLTIGWSVVDGEGLDPLGMLLGVPVALLITTLASLGLGLYFAPKLVKYRDAGSVVGLLVQLGFFIAPIAYPVDLVDPEWRTVQYLNPIAGALGLFRWGVSDAPLPEAHHLAISAGVAVALFLVGMVGFRRSEQDLVDVI